MEVEPAVRAATGAEHGEKRTEKSAPTAGFFRRRRLVRPMQVTLLGTGDTTGTPTVGCDCETIDVIRIDRDG